MDGQSRFAGQTMTGETADWAGAFGVEKAVRR